MDLEISISMDRFENRRDYELRHIFYRIRDKIGVGDTDGCCYDTNGALVGNWSIGRLKERAGRIEKDALPYEEDSYPALQPYSLVLCPHCRAECFLDDVAPDGTLLCWTCQFAGRIELFNALP